VTSRPAAVLGVPAGRLAVGAVADICLLDPRHAWRVGPDALAGRPTHTPFAGLELVGIARRTFAAGITIHRADAGHAP
jgi:dihydroorotase